MVARHDGLADRLGERLCRGISLTGRNARGSEAACQLQGVERDISHAGIAPWIVADVDRAFVLTTKRQIGSLAINEVRGYRSAVFGRLRSRSNSRGKKALSAVPPAA